MGNNRRTHTDNGTPLEKPLRASHEELEDILKLWKLKGKPWPNTMPPVPLDAAHWWMGRQEPMKHWERPTRILIAGTKSEPDKYRILNPFAERLATNLRLFLRLPADEQRLILAAWEDSIFWRGENTKTRLPQFGDMTHFEFIIAETEKMREVGVEEYRKDIIGRAKRTLGAMVTSHE